MGNQRRPRGRAGTPPISIKIVGRRWRLRFCRLKHYGECDPPDKPDKEIRISSRLGDRHEIEIALHEMLHAAAWSQFSEEFVDELARDMAGVLFRLGYRRGGAEHGNSKPS